MTGTAAPDPAAGPRRRQDVNDRRSSLQKAPVVLPAGPASTPSAFQRLPDEIIEQILQATDAGSFASLILLNTKWRAVSQQAHLYAHHLSQCPSYAASHGGGMPAAVTEDRLPQLRGAFAREVKRNLFEAYRRPNKTVIKLVSNSISSSSCPGGEGLQFSPSPLGHHLLAYNSSRIYVIDVRAKDIAVKRELGILRRPLATCVKDDGSVLAVLLTEMQIDIYDLVQSPPKRTQSIVLDHSPRAIALSPCGTALAAAYEGGIEVTAVNPGALATDRRAVKCDAVDALAFSFDGTQILGTTVHSAQPNTVILTAPYYDPGSHMADESISALWTTSILFPNTSRDCSHAVLLQNSSREEASWTFTYDRSFETFRAVRIDDLRNGTTYFTGPIPSAESQGRLLPCALPSASYHGDLVSAGFQGKEIWLYGVPEDLDAVPETATTSSEGGSTTGSLNRRNSGPSMRSSSRIQERPSDARVPQWQVLCDNLRNTFVGGCKIGELDGVSTVKWVANFSEFSTRERLVVAARGVLPPKPITEEDGIDFIDGGRVTLVDFDYGLEDGRTTEITIEVGTKEPEVLEEEHRDMATEVALVRKRTVAQRRGGRGGALMGAGPSAAPPLPAPAPSLPPPLSRQDMDDPLLPRRIGAIQRPAERPTSTGDAETESIEEQEALDLPYSHASPRSGTTLRRAATAAAINRRMNPPPAAAGGHIEYRRADGRREHPHESDADNWVPPPPPYQKDDPQDLPAFMRHNVAPVNLNDGAQATRNAPAPAQPTTGRPALVPSQPARSQTTVPGSARPRAAPRTGPPPAHQRYGSGSSAGRPGTGGSARPMTSTSMVDDDEGLYDVSPPDSPRPTEDRSAVGPRVVSGGSAFAAAGSSPAAVPQVSPVAVPPTSTRQAPFAIPVIHTTAASASPRSPRAPALDLQIPSPTLGNAMWNMSQDSPSNRRLSNSQTWPKPPPHGAPAVLPSGYPYSAPPTNLDANQMIERSFPPAPRPEQLANLQRHGETPPNSQRSSGVFQVPRVPVGSRDSRRFSGGKPLPLPPQPPLQQQPPPPQDPPMHHPRPQRGLDMPRGPPPPVEDQPLIISTPKGVSGAFDPPGRNISTHRTETPILAPVPRHPRALETSAVLGRPVERLQTIYSTGPTLTGPGPAHPGYGFLAAPAPDASQSTTRPSSINRRPSRAERSAAKNIADAKRRGWRGRQKSNNGKRPQRLARKAKKEKDFDAASSAAWTDVTASSSGFTAFWSQHVQGQAPVPRGLPGQPPPPPPQGKGNKCLVM